MPRKKSKPTTFDEWLGKTIEDEADPHGGRSAIAEWIGMSVQSVNRRSRGEAPYLAREVEIIAAHLGVPTLEIVGTALRRYGGREKLMAEYGSDGPASEGAPIIPIGGPLSPADSVPYIGHVTPPIDAAADENPRTGPKE